MKWIQQVGVGAALAFATGAAFAGVSCQPVAQGEVFVSPITNPGKISPSDGTCSAWDVPFSPWQLRQILNCSVAGCAHTGTPMLSSKIKADRPTSRRTAGPMAGEGD